MKNDIFALLGAVLAICAYVPYLLAIARRKIKPAASSWLVWTMLTFLTVISAHKAGNTYPQMYAYLILDPLVMIVGVAMKQWNKFTKLDWYCVSIGVAGGIIYFYSPSFSLIASVVAVTISTIPTIRNVYFKPGDEDKVGWILFTLAGTSSLLSAIINFTSVIDLAAPISYFSTCFIVTVLLFRK